MFRPRRISDFCIFLWLCVRRRSNHTETSLRALLEHLCAKSRSVFGSCNCGTGTLAAHAITLRVDPAHGPLAEGLWASEGTLLLLLLLSRP